MGKRKIVYRYPDGRVYRWSPENYEDAGVLNVPMYHDPEILAEGERAHAAGTPSVRVTRLGEKIEKEWRERWRALRHYYEIPGEADELDAMRDLAVKLARAHVPGFQITTDKIERSPNARRRRRGAPKKRSVTYCYEVVETVEAIRAEKTGRSINEACKLALKRHPETFGAKARAAKTYKSVATLYHQCRKEILRVENSPLTRLMMGL
jgi:hypothetical protein